MDVALSAKPVASPLLTRAAWLRDLFRLVWRGTAVLALGVGTVLAIVLLVPDGNDYARATLKKHARLSTLGAGKLVFVGGSNLAYGMDSALVEQRIERPVVNMGMNGYFGVRYMFEEIKPSLVATDVVVVAFEYDNYYKSADGTGSDLLAISKTNPRAISYLSWSQRWSVAEALPHVAQQKVLRHLRGVATSANRAFGGQSEDAGTLALVLKVESVSGYNQRGDLVSHLGVEWPVEREDGLNASKLPVDEGVLSNIRDFAAWANARGVKVIVSYTSVIDYYYAKHRAALESLHERVRAIPGVTVPSPPSAYVFPEARFFDTVYHLNREGRQERSERVIRDIINGLGATAH